MPVACSIWAVNSWDADSRLLHVVGQCQVKYCNKMAVRGSSQVRKELEQNGGFA